MADASTAHSMAFCHYHPVIFPFSLTQKKCHEIIIHSVMEKLTKSQAYRQPACLPAFYEEIGQIPDKS